MFFVIGHLEELMLESIKVRFSRARISLSTHRPHFTKNALQGVGKFYWNQTIKLGSLKLSLQLVTLHNVKHRSIQL